MRKSESTGGFSRRGPNRSSRKPNPGEAAPIVNTATLKPAEMASRCQPKLSESGFRKRLKVYGTTATKLTMTPKNPASTTFQP
jgi:hypothetical protein